VRWAWVVVAALVAAVAGGSLAWFTGHQAAGQPSAAASPALVRPSAPALTVSQAASLLGRVTSGDGAAVTSAVAMPSGQEVPAAAVHGMHKLAPITADITSFKELSPTLATLSAVDRTGTRWLLHLVWVNGQWLVLDSVKQ
jgi:hypothetical protein